MDTFAKLLIPAVAVLGVATLVGIGTSHSHRTPGDVNSSAQSALAPPETVQLQHRHNRGSMNLPSEDTSIPQQPDVEEAGSESPDTLEDPDEIRAWARSHPHYAREWLSNASEGAKRDAVVEMVCLQMAETNAVTAMTLADRYGAGCTNVLDNIMAQWADQDLQGAYQWAAGRPPGEQRDSFLGRIAFVESKTDPKDAGRLVAEQIPPGQIQDEAAISVLYQWAQKDPNAAMKWAQSFPAGTLHDRALTEVQNVIGSNSRPGNVF
jgi:hypothetical protein